MSNYEPAPYQQPPQKSGSNTGLIVIIVAAVVAIPVMIACIGILIGLLLPAIQAAREASRRMACNNNLKQIAIALHNYESQYNSLPPVYTTDATGRPLHSWRTLILPYLEQQGLYERIDFNKPWDDPANAFLAETYLAVYNCPSSGLEPTFTTYVAVVDPAGVFSGTVPTAFSDVRDGLSNTLMVVETHPQQAVPWMQPTDTDLSALLTSASNQATSNHTGGFNAAHADGSIQFYAENVDPAILEGRITKDGGELINY